MALWEWNDRHLGYSASTGVARCLVCDRRGGVYITMNMACQVKNYQVDNLCR
jgi:hypothetical protein